MKIMTEVLNSIAVTEKVYDVLTDTLGVDEEELDGNSSLIDVYNAESLDFLDISFRLNKEFGIKLFRGDFLERSNEFLAPAGIVILEDGRLTEEGVKLLQARLPESANNPLLAVQMPKTVLHRLYTPQSWVRLVTELVEHPGMTGEDFLIHWLEEYRNNHQ
jgi:acyl carrier protein